MSGYASAGNHAPNAKHKARVANGDTGIGVPAGPVYFLLRRWWRVLRSSLRCFFFDMRLRRFLMTEPTGPTLFELKRDSGMTLLVARRLKQ